MELHSSVVNQSSSPLEGLLFQKPDSSFHLDGKRSIPYPIIWTHQHIAEIRDFILWFTRMWFHVVLFEICHGYGLLLRDDNK